MDSPAWVATMTMVGISFVRNAKLNKVCIEINFFCPRLILMCVSLSSPVMLGNQSGMNSSYYGGSRGSVGMNGMGGGWGM